MKAHSTNYYNTIILPAKDCRTTLAIIPPSKNKKTIANYQYEFLIDHEFSVTSDDLLFNIHAIRQNINSNDYHTERKLFFSKSQPCLRTSPLAKSYGWSFYFNENGYIKLLTPTEAQEIIDNKKQNLNILYAMNSAKQ